MSLSTHYYVLSLSPKTNVLFEAFRDFLIEVENQGFPIADFAPESGTTEDATAQEHRRELARRVDGCLEHHYGREPLKLVVVGSQVLQSAFSSVTTHGTAIIGRIEGDHSATHARDLGKIVWPVVKEAMSGLLDRAMDDLRTFEGRGHLASGLEAVARLASQMVPATLLVEDDYHMKGTLWESSRMPPISSEVDIRDPIDDAVDAVIEKILESGGNVVFMPPGALRDQERIVLLRRDAKGP